MPSSEELAKYVASISEGLTNEEKRKGQGYMVPPPPKPGELIICQQCGKPMYPEDFSKDPKIRKHEFKGHIHHACEQQIWDLVDRQTPGLLSERANGVSVGRPMMHLGGPKTNPNN